MGGEQIFAFRTDAAREAAAVDFLMWLTSTENMIKWDQKTGALPVKASVASSSEYRGFIEGCRAPPLGVCRSAAPCSCSAHPSQSTKIAPWLSPRKWKKAYYGRVSVKEALINAEQALLAILEKGRCLAANQSLSTWFPVFSKAGN